ncbi:MAG TPA: hypothetical protein VI796_02625 [Candidatus Thermoplasmatota archaeon]|nr:hypothetical protein [Candidatus Thermoplasmatota archaeon]
MQSKTNPMRDLLQQQLGIDAFALDGDDTVLVESWQDRERRRDDAVLTVDADWPAEKPRRGQAIPAP